MFKYWSLKKYGNKLLPRLEKQFGHQTFYTPSQVRTVVYQKDFDPTFLPLGYILFVNPHLLNEVMEKEFPLIDINEYRREILAYLDRKSYQGYLQVLKQVTS